MSRRAGQKRCVGWREKGASEESFGDFVEFGSGVVIHFFCDGLRQMAHEVDRDVEGKSLGSPLLGGVGMMAFTEAGGRAVSVEPGTVGSTKDVLGAVVGVIEGNESGVMGEVGGGSPGRRLRDRERGGGGEEKLVKKVTDSTKVVNGEGEEVDTVGVEVSDQERIMAEELGACC